jgi:hypothetical protein
MDNAKYELLEHIAGKDVEFVSIVYNTGLTVNAIRGVLDDVIERLNFEYNAGYGRQQIAGYIWYTDGTWSSRVGRDGGEWWKHNKRPPLNTPIEFY